MTRNDKMVICLMLIALGGAIQGLGAIAPTWHGAIPYLLCGILMWLVVGIVIFIDYLKRHKK